MKFNFLKNWSLFSLLFLFAIAITSCTKEDIEEPAPQVEANIVEDVINRSTLGAFDPIEGFEDCDCFGPLGEVDWENEDPETIMEEVEAYLASLTEEELNALFTPVCTETEFYPNACFAECQGVTDYDVCDDFGFGCEGEDFEVIECYELVYPVTGVFSDGTTVTFDSEEAYFEAIINSGEQPQLVYPFDVQSIDENGTIETITVTSEEQWIELGLLCFDFGGEWDNDNGGGDLPGGDCLYQDFPMTIIVNGESSTIETEEALFQFFDEIFMNNQDPQNLIIEFGYPVNLVNFETGETYVANSEEEHFDLILEHCD